MKGPQVQPFYVLSVLLHQDGNAWVAQGLEKDLVAQGPTEQEAKNRFLRTLTARISDDLADKRPPLSTLPQAPQRYFDGLGGAKVSGPELPVYLPVSPGKAKQVLWTMSARFLSKEVTG